MRPPGFFGEVRKIYIVEDQSSSSLASREKREQLDGGEEKVKEEDAGPGTRHRDRGDGGLVTLVLEDLADCLWLESPARGPLVRGRGPGVLGRHAHPGFLRCSPRRDRPLGGGVRAG